MRKLAFMLAFLICSTPTPIMYEGYLGMEKKEPWNAQKYNSIFEIRTANLKYRDSYKKLKARASLLDFRIALRKGRLDEAYRLQYKGYEDHLRMNKDLSAVAHYATHLIPRET